MHASRMCCSHGAEIVDGEVDEVARRRPAACSEPLSIQTVVMPIALAGVEVARHVLDEQRARGSMPNARAQPGIGRRRAAWARRSIAWMSWIASKLLAEAEPVEHLQRIGRVAVGEDELAPRQPRDRRGQRRVLLEHVHLDIVDVGEEIVRIDVVLGHQPGQRRAVAVEILLLHAPRLVRIGSSSSRAI